MSPSRLSIRERWNIVRPWKQPLALLNLGKRFSLHTHDSRNESAERFVALSVSRYLPFLLIDPERLCSTWVHLHLARYIVQSCAMWAASAAARVKWRRMFHHDFRLARRESRFTVICGAFWAGRDGRFGNGANFLDSPWLFLLLLLLHFRANRSRRANRRKSEEKSFQVVTTISISNSVRSLWCRSFG